ncbi:hypothetical protein SAMN05421677_1028 [Halobacillus aidingensis]|uniref:Uncharacterized protein n=1 Tax=Halobacillus aidingensis TaxID=240303 RepID=A0A1H0FH40_HALAD|nr:hypothetical protein SAMN05421677_1028 [Halobacillus aidingensis]
MLWFRMIMIGMFSLTALSLLSYQGTEIYHAFLEFFNKK